MEKCVVDYLPNRRGESSASLANRSDSRFFGGGEFQSVRQSVALDRLKWRPLEASFHMVIE